MTKKIHERLLRESNLTQDKAVLIFRAAEEVKLQANEIQRSAGGAENDSKVDYVSNQKRRAKFRPSDTEGKSGPSVNEGNVKLEKKETKF